MSGPVHVGAYRALHDCCEGCLYEGEQLSAAAYEPIGIAWLDGGWVRLVYICALGHRWTCGWAVAMADPADARASEEDFIYLPRRS
jgi:hypothetical protein